MSYSQVALLLYKTEHVRVVVEAICVLLGGIGTDDTYQHSIFSHACQPKL